MTKKSLTGYLNKKPVQAAILGVIVILLVAPPFFSFIVARLQAIPTEQGLINFDVDVTVANSNHINRESVDGYFRYFLADYAEQLPVSVEQLSEISEEADAMYEIELYFDEDPYTEQAIIFDATISMSNVEWRQVTYYTIDGIQIKVFNILPDNGSVNILSFIYQTELEGGLNSYSVYYKGFNDVTGKNVFLTIYYSFIYFYGTRVTTETTTTKTILLEPTITPYMTFSVFLMIMAAVSLIRIKRKKDNAKAIKKNPKT